MVDVRMLRTSPATRSFWTAADAGSAGISWPHATEYQALHYFFYQKLSKPKRAREIDRFRETWSNIWSNMIQHDPTQPTSRLGPNPGLAAGLWAANRRLRPFPWMQCLSSNCVAEALAEGLDVHDVRRFVALRLSAVFLRVLQYMCIYIYANNKSGSIILENVKRLCNWLMWSEGHKQQHWSFAIDHVVLRFAGHMCCYQPSYPGVRCESGEGNCEDTTSRP